LHAPSVVRLRAALGPFLVALLLAVPALADKPECAKGGNVPNLAVNCPDQFAWQKFVEVNLPVGGVGGNVAFQTYSSDADTFPCPPVDLATCRANPKATGCPVWPTVAVAKPSLFTQRSVRLLAGHHDSTKLPEDDCWDYYNLNNVEIVYRNRATFDYIVAHGLWYVEGVETQFEKGFVYDFPVDSVEVKTNWLPLTDAQVKAGRFHTVMMTNPNTGKNQVYGLAAMHISSKDLPNWFWATFEHVDNWGRCDFLGCHDSFGTIPANIPPHEPQLCQTYPAGELTPALKQMLAKLPPVFQNYRLKGSMTDFTSPTGSPNLLGNSITEAGFVPTASCITCHSRAAVQATASGNPGTLGANGLSPYPNVAGFTPENQSYNGAPDPNWYYAGNRPIRHYAVQTDFVWAIPFKSSSVQATAKCCSANGGVCQTLP
jgi:hypothetical protein